MDYSFIGFGVADGVATITFNRPEVMNAWHETMRNEVLDGLSRVRQDDGIKALVFTGAGERAFSAGQDINESNDFDEDRAERWINEFRALYSSVRSLEKPVVAAVNGVAAGSAFQFVLLTDVRVGPWRHDHGPAGNQLRHRQHNRAVDHARDPGIVTNHRDDAHRTHGRRRGGAATRPAAPRRRA